MLLNSLHDNYPELVSNSAHCSWIPGSEPILLDLEKLFLLSDSMENRQFYGKIEISEPENFKKLSRFLDFPCVSLVFLVFRCFSLVFLGPVAAR